MKPEDLKVPFKWNQRKILFQDHVLYVPNYYDQYDQFKFPGWTNLFGREAPLKVEYCSGNGAWILERALSDPGSNWVAVEQQFPRARKIWSKIKNHNLTNLIVVCGEGKLFTKHFLEDNTVNEVFVNFPDPWPKTRHLKHRIIEPVFSSELHRVLQLDGKTNLVTDDKDTSDWMIKIMLNSFGFSSAYEDPFYITDFPGYGSSWFDDLWRKTGKTIHYHLFRKTQ